MERRLVVGLGNPGRRYEKTRHNAGFWVVDTLISRHRISVSEKPDAHVGSWMDHFPSDATRGTPDRYIEVVVVKPQTFMNRSGDVAFSLLHRFHLLPSHLIVVHDDLDLPCGKVRIKTKGHSGGHRGVASVIESLGSDQFQRIKIGIGPNPNQDAADYVLSPFSVDEIKQIIGAIARAADAIPLLLEGKIDAARRVCSALGSQS